MDLYKIIFVLVMALGFVALLITIVRFILSRYKIESHKIFKYDDILTHFMYLTLCLTYIQFFISRFEEAKKLEFAPIIIWAFIILLLPYNFIATMACGIKKKYMLNWCLRGMIIDALVFAFYIIIS